MDGINWVRTELVQVRDIIPNLVVQDITVRCIPEHPNSANVDKITASSFLEAAVDGYGGLYVIAIRSILIRPDC